MRWLESGKRRNEVRDQLARWTLMCILKWIDRNENKSAVMKFAFDRRPEAEKKFLWIEFHRHSTVKSGNFFCIPKSFANVIDVLKLLNLRGKSRLTHDWCVNPTTTNRQTSPNIRFITSRLPHLSAWFTPVVKLKLRDKINWILSLFLDLQWPSTTSRGYCIVMLIYSRYLVTSSHINYS